MSSIDGLAALMSTFDWALLTIVDAQGRPRTRPMRPLKAPFNGHIWFRPGADAAAAEEIGRGAEVSVAYGGAASGPHITVNGWAIVLRVPEPAPSVWRSTSMAPQSGAGRLICIAARAAEVWDAASTSSRRVFAFAGSHRACEIGPPPQERALAPRLVAISTMPCAS